jgi:hypothetical protein
MNHLTAKSPDNLIEKEVKEWLKFASERDGGKKLRELEKANARRQERSSDIVDMDCFPTEK